MDVDKDRRDRPRASWVAVYSGQMGLRGGALLRGGWALAIAGMFIFGLLGNLYAAEGGNSRGGVIIDGDRVSVEKRAELETGDIAAGGVARPQQILTYTIVITSNDVSTLPSIVVTDSPSIYTDYVTGSTQIDVGSGFEPVADLPSAPFFPLGEGFSIEELEPDATATLRYQMQVTDVIPVGIDSLENVVEVLAGADVVSATLSVPVRGNPGVMLVKQVEGADGASPPGVLVRAGAPISWTYTVTNSGAFTLTDLVLTDSDPVITPTLSTGDILSGLPPGSAVTYLAEGIAQAGQYSNTAVVTATVTDAPVADNADVVPAQESETVTATATSYYFGVAPALMLTKTVTPATFIAPISDTVAVSYAYALVNSGNVSLTNVIVVDDLCSPVMLPGESPQPDGGFTLAISETVALGCSSVVSDTTINFATAVGIDPLGVAITATATATVTRLGAALDLAVTPSAPAVEAGTPVTYSYVVSNTGAVSVTELVLVDSVCTEISPQPESEPVLTEGLAAGAQAAFQCTVVISESTTSLITVTGIGPSSVPVTATATAFVDVPGTGGVFDYWAPILEKGERPPVECPLPAGCPIAGGEDVKALVYHTGLNRLYVLSQEAERVFMVDPATFAVLGEAATGAQPWGMVVNETTNRLYVSNFLSGTVTVLDATTLDTVAELDVEGNPGEMAVLPARDQLFVLTRPDSRVLVFEGTTLVQDLPAGGSGPYGIVVNEEGEQVYISHRDSGSLSLLYWLDDAWTALPGPQFADGRQYFSVDWNPTTGRLYVLAADSQSQWRLEVWQPSVTPPWSLLTAPALPSGGDILTAAVGGAGLLVNPGTGQIYTANTGDQSISRVEGVNDILVETLPAGNDPFVLALDPTGNILFVGLRANGAVVKLVVE